MTKEDFIEKYGEVKVKFSSYYKYTFSFSGELSDGGKICVSYGGCSDDIYRYEVSADYEETVKSVYPCSGSVYKDGEEIDSFYDY
jgi:hypothetical protein